MWFLCIYDFWQMQPYIFAKFGQHAVLRCKLWTINSFCTPKSLSWFFVENFLIKSCFFIIQWFSQFWCMSKLFRMWGATVMRLALCVYLYLGHDCLHLYEEKVDLSKTVFIQLPYTTWVVNKHLYETWWSGLTPAWYSENISVIAIY